jgi:hypothetical protein
LERFDAPGLHDGAVAECVIRAPLPYSVRLRIEVERTVEARLVETTVGGDLAGPASLALAPEGTGTLATLRFDLEVRHQLLRAASLVGRPLLVWAHDRVVDRGVEQFRDRALDGA